LKNSIGNKIFCYHKGAVMVSNSKS